MLKNKDNKFLFKYLKKALHNIGVTEKDMKK